MTTRQELYDRIRESSKDEVILEEMIRLGFWPDHEEMPSDPASQIKRKGELERELAKLTFENRQLKNVEAIKREQRQKRLAESKRKRAERKEEKIRQRAEKAAAWKKKQQSEITFLGDGYSAGLSRTESDESKLARHGLSAYAGLEGLAAAMNVSVGLLRFLAFGRKTSTVHHYRRFTLAKKSGGNRVISAPMPKLKTAQRWILDHVLSKPELHNAAHGFCPDKSIVSNALPHVGAKLVLNMDLKDFFPTIEFKRIRGVFRNLGFSDSMATILAMLCSESPVTEVALDGQEYFVARGERVLPQGAPTSPAITNLICRGLDARLTRIAEKLGFIYTRYADDITFSSSDPTADVGRAIRQIEYVVQDEDLVVHPDKTRILRKGRRLEVTGLTVNEKLNVSRSLLKKFRALLFQIEKDGPAGKTWGQDENVIASIFGFANFVLMVNPEKGQKLMGQVRRIIQLHGTGGLDLDGMKRNRAQKKAELKLAQLAGKTPAEPSAHESSNKAESTPPEKPKKKPWWKLW